MKFSETIKPGWGIAPVVVFIGLWELTSRLDLLPLVPPFTAVMEEFYRLSVSGVLPAHFLRSLIRVLAGFCGGSVAGLITGVFLGWKDIFNKTFSPIISLLYPIPALGWLPLFMLWIGISEALPIAIIFTCSFFPVCYNTATGIRGVNRDLVQVARTLGASESRILTTIVIPLALPAIFTGLRLEAGMAWRVIIAAEMVAIPTGIGALLMRAESLIRVDIIIVCLIILSLMCLSFEKFFLFLEHRLTRRWT
ncbi:MAG: ABC transporter permease [Deltaproteobacteria bacterium]|nr:ABC transporter permease [Deltaproteobacteria bacterium]